MAVRRESVELSLTGDFTTKAAQAAAAAAILRKEVDGLGKSGKNISPDLSGVERDVEKVGKSLGKAEREVDKFGKSSGRSGTDINKLTGRLRLLTDVSLTLGPALVPIGAGLVPALSAMAVGATAGAAALGVTLLAVNGLGDGLKALNEYQLEQTPENLAAMQAELAKLGPDGAHFVRFLDTLEPALAKLQMAARAGLLPGVEAGISEILPSLPKIEDFVTRLAQTMGTLSADAGASLAGDDFKSFFTYLSTDAAPTLDAFARSVGNVAEGLANMLVGLAPATRDFTGGLEDLTARFAEWSRGLDDNESWQGFVDYVRESGPQVMALLGAIATTFASIAEAAAPVGSTVLPIFTELVQLIGKIAASPFGSVFFTAAAAMVAYGRAASLASRLTATMTANLEKTGRATKGLSAGAKLGGLIVGLTAVNQLLNEIDKPLDAGNLDRNITALAQGTVTDDFDDLARSLDNVTSAKTKADEVLAEPGSLFGVLGGTKLDNAQDRIKSIDSALASMVESGNAKEAAAALDTLIKATEDRGVDGDEARRQFTQYDQALKNVAASGDAAADGIAGSTDAAKASEAAADKATLAASLFAAANQRNADAALAEAEALNAAVDAIQAKHDATVAAFDAETGYRQALKDARKAAAENSAGIRGNSDAALDNRAKLGSLAAAWNNQSAAVQNNKKKFNEARSAFIQTAVDMGVPQKAAEDLARSLLDIPRSRAVKIIAETAAALAAVDYLQSKVAALRNKTIYINAVQNPAQAGQAVPPKGGGGGGKTPERTAAGGGPITFPTGNTFVPAPRVPVQGPVLVGAGTMRRGGGITVTVSDVRMTGAIKTEFGPAHVAGIAQVVARAEIDADAEFNRDHRGG